MRILLAIIWTSPFILLSYLTGGLVADQLRRGRPGPDKLTLALVAAVVIAGMRNTVALVSMAFGGTPGRVDWFLLFWLGLVCLLAAVAGDNYRTEDSRKMEINLGRWATISISAIGIVFAALVIAGGLLEVADMFPRPASVAESSWSWSGWARNMIARVSVMGGPQKKEGAPASFKEQLRRQKIVRERALNKYLAGRDRRSGESAGAGDEPQYDPKKLAGWAIEPASLAPAAVPGWRQASAIALGDNVYEIVFEPDRAESQSENGDGTDAVTVTLVVTKQDAAEPAEDYLQTSAAQYGFENETVTVAGGPARAGFYGGMLRKHPVYEQAFFGWTTSLFVFEVVARAPHGPVGDKRTLSAPAFAVADITRRLADPAIAANKPAR